MKRTIISSLSILVLHVAIIITGVYAFSWDLIDVLMIEVVLQVNFWLIVFFSRNQNKILCDKCHHKNRRNSTNCVKCGSGIENIICPTCKGVNQYNQKYCRECETKLVCGECSI